MREFVFIFLYGAVTFASILLAIFWGRFAAQRRSTLIGNIFKDRYFVLSLGVTIDAAAWTVITGMRVVSNYHYGLSKALYGWEGAGIAIGLIAAIFSKVMLVWLADLEDHPPRWPWTKALVIGTAIWGGVAALTTSFMPDYDFRPDKISDGG